MTVRSYAERRLVVLLIVVGACLTGLTIWAVVRQGQALRAREWANLQSLARAAASQRQAALSADVQRAFDALARRGAPWEEGGANDLDGWLGSHYEWLLACVQGADGSWQVHPRTPLEQPLPTAGPGAEEPQPGSRDLLTLLRDLQQVASDPDPLTRAGALLAIATIEQQLGHPLAAARIFADAARLLRSTPRLARFAFRAELSRIESLLAAGDHDRANQALTTFVNSLVNDHPAGLGPTELARLEQAAQALGSGSREPPALDVLRTRVRERTLVADAAVRLLRAQDQELSALRPGGASFGLVGGEVQLLSGPTADQQTIVVAVGAIAADVRLALVCDLDRLLARYWKVDEQTPWQVRVPGGRSDWTLAVLGPGFGNAELEPSPASAAKLRAMSRRQLGLVLATIVGTAGAWGLVIWMMSRVVARQRELTRLQGRFVADVSHELKTPLALIRLLAETLAEQRVTDPQRVRDYHQTITRESERLSLLLDNILDLGRIESGRKLYEFGPCNVADVARQAWTLFEPQFAAEGFDARLELAADLPVIRADAQALQQVLVNLLQNAHRYAGTAKYVRLSVAREGYVILITVEDHGIGMSRSQVERLGESFFRAEDTRVRQSRGVGLGLAIANHIVTAHRGKIEVQSRPGQGSKFTVWIPFEP